MEMLMCLLIYITELILHKFLPTSLTNVQTLSSQGTGVLNGITVSKMNPPIAVFPLPVLSAVPTGIAPDGTLVLTNISGTYGLYARVNSTWVYIGPDIGL